MKHALMALVPGWKPSLRTEQFPVGVLPPLSVEPPKERARATGIDDTFVEAQEPFIAKFPAKGGGVRIPPEGFPEVAPSYGPTSGVMQGHYQGDKENEMQNERLATGTRLSLAQGRGVLRGAVNGSRVPASRGTRFTPGHRHQRTLGQDGVLTNPFVSLLANSGAAVVAVVAASRTRGGFKTAAWIVAILAGLRAVGNLSEFAPTPKITEPGA